MVDTVENARSTPDAVQPWGELGLSSDECARIKEILGRRPTGCELALYAVMWSERCSYASSKVHLRRLEELSQTIPRGAMLAGTGRRAGVVDIGAGWAVAFAIESHNHPNSAESREGAATGIGGVIRGVLARGARPIGVLDALRFGPLDAPETARVLPAVVAGVGGYGNCVGVPTIGAEVVFDPTYDTVPLVNVLCVGALRRDGFATNAASGVGNVVILFGAATSRDGFSVGDPFLGELLIECCLELFASGIVVGIQDVGAAGLVGAVSEMVAAGDGGVSIDLDAVELVDSALSPEEILVSESQERMVAVVRPGDVDAFTGICAKWGVPAAVVGAVIEGDRLLIDSLGERVVDVDPRSVAGGGPVYERRFARPGWMDELASRRAEDLPRAASGAELADQVLRLAGSPNLCDKSWVTDQYDRYVRGDSVLAQPEDVGMLRIDEKTGLGVALATDGKARFALLNPYFGAQLALSEAYRRAAVSGAEPVAITHCLNFGSPEDPDVMWQFREAVWGLADACQALGTPVASGAVSLGNQSDDKRILPTPVVGVIGVIDDVAHRVPMGFEFAGDAVCLLGVTEEELSGSAWAGVVHDHLGGTPPTPDLGAEQRLASVLVSAARRRLLTSAHGLSEGGLAQGLVECCLRRGLGVAVNLPGGDPTVQLFSESPARAIVSLPGATYAAFEALCREHEVPFARLGEVTHEAAIEVRGQFTLGLADVRARWQAPIREAMTGR